MDLIKSSPSNSISSSTTGASSFWNFTNIISIFNSDSWTLPKVVLVTTVTLSVGFGGYFLYKVLKPKGIVLTPENKQTLRAEQDLFIRERGSAMAEHFQRNRNNSEILEEIPVIAESTSPVLEENPVLAELKKKEFPSTLAEPLAEAFQRNPKNSQILEEIPVIPESTSPVLEENLVEEVNCSESPVLEEKKILEELKKTELNSTLAEPLAEEKQIVEGSAKVEGPVLEKTSIEEFPISLDSKTGNYSFLKNFLADTGHPLGNITKTEFRYFLEVIHFLEIPATEWENKQLFEIKKKALSFPIPKCSLTRLSRIPSDVDGKIHIPEQVMQAKCNRCYAMLKEQFSINTNFQNANMIRNFLAEYRRSTEQLNETINRIELKNREIQNLKNDEKMNDPNSQTEQTAEISDDSLDEQTVEISDADLQEWTYNVIVHNTFRNAMSFCMNYADLILEFFK